MTDSSEPRAPQDAESDDQVDLRDVLISLGTPERRRRPRGRRRHGGAVGPREDRVARRAAIRSGRGRGPVGRGSRADLGVLARARVPGSTAGREALHRRRRRDAVGGRHLHRRGHARAGSRTADGTGDRIVTRSRCDRADRRHAGASGHDRPGRGARLSGFSAQQCRVALAHAEGDRVRLAAPARRGGSPPDHARASSEGGTETVLVGFADLVGFTAKTQQLEEAELAEVVGRFETVAYDVVAEHGGRVVKMIGDEVMFLHDERTRRRGAGARSGRAFPRRRQPVRRPRRPGVRQRARARR